MCITYVKPWVPSPVPSGKGKLLTLLNKGKLNKHKNDVSHQVWLVAHTCNLALESWDRKISMSSRTVWASSKDSFFKNLKTGNWLVPQSFDPSTSRHRQADLHECEANLVYVASSTGLHSGSQKRNKESVAFPFLLPLLCLLSNCYS